MQALKLLAARLASPLRNNGIISPFLKAAITPLHFVFRGLGSSPYRPGRPQAGTLGELEQVPEEGTYAGHYRSGARGALAFGISGLPRFIRPDSHFVDFGGYFGNRPLLPR